MPTEGPYRLSAQEFEAAVDEALGRIPSELLDALSNLAIFVEAECPPGEEQLLGLYDGIPLTERQEGAPWGLPDRITLFQGPLERMCATRDQLVEQVAVTVIHEIAHYFGISDARLAELGWD
ncbi:MAG: metallopeptidase family protein [Dermatophilaceae bacterium]